MRWVTLGLAMLFMVGVLSAQEKTDRSYPTDRFDYAGVQADIDELSNNLAVDPYDLAKAQAWLNSSKYEMWRNDSGWWPKEAFDEATRVVAAIKNKDQAFLLKTSSLKLDQLIANDLWIQVAETKKLEKVCAKKLLAKAEVELVHAAYEAQETRWKDSAPQLALVRSFLGRAKSCL
mgnify:CR=1 FL=1